MAEGGTTISTLPDESYYRPYVEQANRKERRKQKAINRKGKS